MDLKNALIEAYAMPAAERRQPFGVAAGCTTGSRIIVTRGAIRSAWREMR